MSTPALEDLTRQANQLDAEDKLELLARLVESLRGQLEPAYVPLITYYGAGAGQGFQTAEEVDAHLREERAQWER
jgi:hypothetical protein